MPINPDDEPLYQFLQDRRLETAREMEKQAKSWRTKTPTPSDVVEFEAMAKNLKSSTELVHYLREAHRSMVTVRSEPTTYRPDSRHSYFQDLVTQRHSQAAQDRLQRHAQEMEAVQEEREGRALREMRSASIEYRVEPSTTQGHGGYFTVPLWLNQYFATANRPGRVLSGLMRTVPLPAGASSINIPAISTGTSVLPFVDTAAVPDTDIVDTSSSSNVATFGGQLDVSLQLLEQSPAGAHLDWAVFQDLTEAYDAQLESQLINGSGSNQQLLGLLNVSGITSVSFTGSSTGTAMWPYLGQLAAQLADARKQPPLCWLMRSSRWFWFNSAEDTSQRPFGLPSYYFGRGSSMPDPIGGLQGLPVFLTESVPATLGSGANQDVIIASRPTDSILLESEPTTAVIREPGSGSMSARLQWHGRAAALTSRRPASIAVLSGSGMAIASGY